MPEPLKLSYSRVSTFQTCERKYYWTYVRNIIPTARQLPLEFGKAWHLAMNTWHRTHELPTAIAAFDAAYIDPQDDERRTRKTAHRMLELYAKRYDPEVLTFRAYEQWIARPIGSVLYRMRVDGVVVWDDRLEGAEHKTASSLGYHYLKSFKPNLQVAGTIWGLQQAVDPAITSLLIDIARVTYLEPKEGERFHRHRETVESWEIEEFLATIHQIGDTLLAKGEDFAAYTPNWGACTDFGECPYRLLCTAQPSIRESLITKFYATRPEAPEGDQ